MGRFMTYTESSNVDFKENEILDKVRCSHGWLFQQCFDMFKKNTRSGVRTHADNTSIGT